MAVSDMNKRITVTISREQYNYIKEQAQEGNRSISQVASLMLEQYLNSVAPCENEETSITEGTADNKAILDKLNSIEQLLLNSSVKSATPKQTNPFFITAAVEEIFKQYANKQISQKNAKELVSKEIGRHIGQNKFYEVYNPWKQQYLKSSHSATPSLLEHE